MRQLLKHIRLFLAALLVLQGWSSPAYAAKPADTKPADTKPADTKPAVAVAPKTSGSEISDQASPGEKLLEASGIAKELRKMDGPAVVDTALLEFLGLSTDETAILSNMYAKVFHADAYYKDVLGAFEKGVDKTHFAAVSEWFLSPQGKKAAWRESISPARSGFRKEEKMKPSEMPSEERLLLIVRLEKAMDSTSLAMAQIQRQLQNLAPLSAELRKRGSAALLGNLEKSASPLRERVALSLLHAYRGVSDQDLAALAGFTESAHGQWFFQLRERALIDAQNRLGDAVAGHVTAFLKMAKSGKDDKQVIRDVLPAGARYLFAQERDPFAPFSGVSKETTKINFSRVMLKNAQRLEQSRPPTPRFTVELKLLQPIPLPVYSRLKAEKPALYEALERYGALFKAQKDLRAMNDAEYRNAVEEYKSLINKANSAGKEMILGTPLQVSYDSLQAAGLIWKKGEPFALIETGEKLGYSARKGTLIGPDHGAVESIDQNKIVVLERQRDFKGDILTRKKEMQFNLTKKTNEDQP